MEVKKSRLDALVQVQRRRRQIDTSDEQEEEMDRGSKKQRVHSADKTSTVAHSENAGSLVRGRRKSNSSDEQEEEMGRASKKQRVHSADKTSTVAHSGNAGSLEEKGEEEVALGSRLLSDGDIKRMITSIQNTDCPYLNAFDSRFKNHRSQFYETFVPIWAESRKNNSPMLDQLSYNEISATISRSNIDNSRIYNSTVHYRYKELYKKIGGLNEKLYRENKKDSGDWKEVPTVECLHQIILEAHTSRGSNRTIASIKSVLNDRWYKVPERAVQVFLANCPCCLKKKKVWNKTKKNRLKMILTSYVGERSQMDLIDFRRNPKNGMQWIFRIVDVMSGYGIVKVLPSKSSAVVGRALVEVLCSSILPNILQSDNGKEFLGTCIDYVRKYFSNMQVVRGRPYHPQSQGVVERSNGRFQRALDSWTERMGGEGNPKADWTLGAFIVQAEINNTPHEGRGGVVPSMLYFGQTTQLDTVKRMIGDDLYEQITTEYAYMSVKALLDEINNNNLPPINDQERLSEFIKCHNSIQEVEELLAFDCDLRMFYEAEAKSQGVVDLFKSSITSNEWDDWKRFVLEEFKAQDNFTIEGKVYFAHVIGNVLGTNLFEMIRTEHTLVSVEKVLRRLQNHHDFMKDRLLPTVEGFINILDQVLLVCDEDVVVKNLRRMERKYTKYLLREENDVDAVDEWEEMKQKYCDEYGGEIDSNHEDNPQEEGDALLDDSSRNMANDGKEHAHLDAFTKIDDDDENEQGQSNAASLKIAEDDDNESLVVTLRGDRKTVDDDVKAKEDRKPVDDDVEAKEDDVEVKDDYPRTLGALDDIHNTHADGSVIIGVAHNTSDVRDVSSENEDTDEDDDKCCHPCIKETTKNELTARAVAGQKKQAEKANKHRKENLDDIAEDTVVYVEENSKYGLCKIHAVVIEIKERKSKGQDAITKLYKIQSCHGVIRESFQRERLYPVGSQITTGIIGSDKWPTEEISLKDAFFREQGRKHFCRCTAGDCSKSKKCTCKANGLACTSKCHGGNGKNSKCCLMI
jgi:hypothetical protein